MLTIPEDVLSLLEHHCLDRSSGAWLQLCSVNRRRTDRGSGGFVQRVLTMSKLMNALQQTQSQLITVLETQQFVLASDHRLSQCQSRHISH